MLQSIHSEILIFAWLGNFSVSDQHSNKSKRSGSTFTVVGFACRVAIVDGMWDVGKINTCF